MTRQILSIIVIVVCVSIPVVYYVWRRVERESRAYDLTRRER